MDATKDYNNYSDKVSVDNFLIKYKNIESRNRYEATIKELLQLINFKSTKEITKEELKNYYEIIKDNVAKVSHIREYYKYLISNRYLSPEVIDDGQFIDWVYKFKPIEKNKNRPAIEYPLNTVIGIDSDIKKNYVNPPKEDKWGYERTMKIAFVWELIFDAGVDVNILKKVKAKYFFDRQSYVDSKEKNKIVDMYYENNQDITAIVKKYNTLLIEIYKKPTRDGFNDLECLSLYKNDELQVYGLLPQDIKAARKKLYTKCHNCGTEQKIEASNWIIVQLQDSQDKYIVCNTCKGKALYGK